MLGRMTRSRLCLSFHGAAGMVTGSKHLLSIDDTRTLLDAGLFQGGRHLRRLNWERPGFAPGAVDRVLVSHTHIDHIGYLPRLVREGLEAPVHLTPAAHDLAELALLDSAKIQEEDARYANKKGYSRHDPALPLYTLEDAKKALSLRQRLPFGEWLDLGDRKSRGSRARARFLNSGHLLGAAFLEIHVEPSPGSSRSEPLRIVYSGDVGRFEVPLHLDPQPLPSCDVLLIESTYGDRDHPDTSILEQIRRPFADTLSRKGTVLIPAFAIGRSQQLTLILRRLMQRGELPEVPIHIDSPMAVNATDIYSRFLDERNVDADVFEDGRLRLFPEDVHFHRSVSDSKRLNDLEGPRILISSSGMLSGGRVLHHLKRLAPDPDNLLMLAGYQAEGTRSRALLDGADSVKVHGRWIPVRCRVMSLQGLSGHADRGELLRWVGSAPEPPRLAFLVHGEPRSAAALARELRQRFEVRTFTPELDEEVELEELL